METTIGAFTSRLRQAIKAVGQDPFLTDRFLYALVMKQAPWLLKREDGANKLLKQDSIVQQLDYVELISVDKADIGCRGIRSGCTIKRTRDPLPELWDGYHGALLRSVTSLDGSTELQPIDLAIFNNIRRQTSYRYNVTRYYWMLERHLYFPDLEWDAVRVEGIFKDDISAYGCDDCRTCRPRQEQPLNIPGYLHGELESHVLKELRDRMGIPADTFQDKQNLNR